MTFLKGKNRSPFRLSAHSLKVVVICSLSSDGKIWTMPGDTHSSTFELNRSVSGKFGVAGVKCASELGGYYGGDPRLPLLPLKDEAKKTIKDAVAQANLL
jgi:hypothetical protein